MGAIESYGNYSSFGIFNKWSECGAVGCEFHLDNFIFDMMIIIPIIIIGYYFYRIVIKKL